MGAASAGWSLKRRLCVVAAARDCVGTDSVLVVRMWCGANVHYVGTAALRTVGAVTAELQPPGVLHKSPHSHYALGVPLIAYTFCCWKTRAPYFEVSARLCNVRALYQQSGFLDIDFEALPDPKW